MLAPNSEWGLRVQRAFAAELAAQGGHWSTNVITILQRVTTSD
jgi:outer membrane PBP1 activator LpoA protein